MDEKTATKICQAIASSDSVLIPTPDALRPMYLIVVSGGIPGALHRMEPGATRLGRSQENDVRFPDLSVSRHHAAVNTDAAGSVWLTDLGSSNGTFLNGGRVAPHHAHQLQDGDRVQFGASIVVKFDRLAACDEQFQRELYERTVRDPLTGLYNRAYFLNQIANLAERGSERELGLAVLMVDIDHFKRVNDSLGHDAGDAVLREVAAVLRRSTRSEDLVARYGGEEFVIALPSVDHDLALKRAERIRAGLASRPIRIPTGGSLTALPGPLRVTASLGLAFAHPGRNASPHTLITAADQCLYQAKNAGRNRVVSRVDPFPGAAPASPELVTPRSREARVRG